MSIFIGIGTVAGAIASLLVSILVTSANDQRLVYAAFVRWVGCDPWSFHWSQPWCLASRSASEWRKYLWSYLTICGILG